MLKLSMPVVLDGTTMPKLHEDIKSYGLAVRTLTLRGESGGLPEIEVVGDEEAMKKMCIEIMGATDDPDDPNGWEDTKELHCSEL